MSVESPATWNRLEEIAEADGNQYLLSSVRKCYLESILKTQVREANGEVVVAMRNTLESIKKIERATLALHEHERLMDKEFFKALVKQNFFQISGTDKELNRPMCWLREGVRARGIWRHMPGSPKAHSMIRHTVYIYQQAFACMLAENETIVKTSAPMVSVIDMSGGSMIDFNVWTVERGGTLLNMMFMGTACKIVFAGINPAVKIILKLLTTVLPQYVSESWTLLDRKLDILQIVSDQRDIPEWWFAPNNATADDVGPIALDPRSTCWYERCLSDDNKITMRDVFNPDPEQWRCGLRAYNDLADVSNCAINEFEVSSASELNGRSSRRGKNSRTGGLEAIEETFAEDAEDHSCFDSC